MCWVSYFDASVLFSAVMVGLAYLIGWAAYGRPDRRL